MKDLLHEGLGLRILLIGILIALFGLMPGPKTLASQNELALRSRHNGGDQNIAAAFAFVADHQPWRSGFWEAAGDAALASEDHQNAGLYYSRAAAKGELTLDGFLSWGDVEWQLGNPYTALQIWEIAERNGASLIEVLAKRVEVYRALGADLELIETLRSILHYQDMIHRFEYSALYHELGLLLAAHDPASAPAYLSRSVEMDPALEPQIGSLIIDIQQTSSVDDPAYLYMISGRSLANLGHWELAEKAFHNALDHNPTYAEAWAYLGEARQHTDSGDDPFEALETALEIDPFSIAANSFMAFYLQRQGELELALVHFKKAADLDPDNYSYLVEIGKLTALLGDLEGGKESFKQAITRSSNDPRYVREFLKFSIHFNLDLQNVALPVARQLVILDPLDAASLDIMGELLMRLGDLLNAERFFWRSLAQDPDYDWANLHLGDLYWQKGDYDLARYHFNKVLDVSSNAQIQAYAQKRLEQYFSP